MPPHPGPTVRSSSRSSKRADPPAGGGATRDGAWLPVGVVVAAHALRGLLRVRPHQPPAPSLIPERTIRLDGPHGSRDVLVVSASPHGRGQLLLGVAGVEDRDAAEALVGSTVLVRAEDLPPPDPGEFYWHEIEGFRVETVDGRAIGTIAETFASGAHDVWVVRGEREHMIPVVADVVREIDRASRRVLIDPPAGLLD